MDDAENRQIIRSNLTEALRLLDRIGEDVAAAHIETALYALDVAAVAAKGRGERPSA
jgi:hypothetical protein